MSNLLMRRGSVALLPKTGHSLPFPRLEVNLYDNGESFLSLASDFTFYTPLTDLWENVNLPFPL